MSFNDNDNSNSSSENGGMRKKKRRLTQRRKRVLDPGILIDYKNSDLIKRFITERGKIIPRRISGATQAQQRQIAIAVKRSRFLALIPSTATHRVERGFAGRIQAIMQTFSNASIRQKPRFERGDRSERGERSERSAGHDSGKSEQKFTAQNSANDAPQENNNKPLKDK